jgi:hypothetical protein
MYYIVEFYHVISYNKSQIRKRYGQKLHCTIEKKQKFKYYIVNEMQIFQEE